MFFDGHITDLGDLPCGRGVSFTLNSAQTIHLVGLTKQQTRELSRMLYHRITIRIVSEDDRARFNDEHRASDTAEEDDDGED